MARIFITGSADGLGKMAAQLLTDEGHEVVLHGRNKRRAEEALKGVPGASTAVAGDLSSIKETIDVARQVNALGAFDAVIHNAGVGYRERLIRTIDGLPHVLAINALAPYILTCLIGRPRRLVYLSSGMNQHAESSLGDITWTKRPWNGSEAYSASKLYDIWLAFAIARKWTGILSNSVEPGWVATKMGGAGAPDNLEEGPKTQVWLAVSDDPAARVTGKHFYHKQQRRPNPAANELDLQERFIEECRKLTGISLPV